MVYVPFKIWDITQTDSENGRENCECDNEPEDDARAGNGGPEASRRNHRVRLPDPLLHERRALQPGLVVHHVLFFFVCYYYDFDCQWSFAFHKRCLQRRGGLFRCAPRGEWWWRWCWQWRSARRGSVPVQELSELAPGSSRRNP